MDQALTRDDILTMDDVVIEPHVCKWWHNRTVYARSISAFDRGNIEAAAAKFKESHGKEEAFAKTFTVKMAWLGMCDEKGNRLFPNEADVALLQNKNAAQIADIAEHVQHLSGFSKDDLEQLEKNSGKAEADDLPSA